MITALALLGFIATSALSAVIGVSLVNDVYRGDRFALWLLRVIVGLSFMASGAEMYTYALRWVTP